MQFFANGGNQAYIIRLIAGGGGAGAAAAATTTMAAGTGTITFEAATQGAANPGAWANNYGIIIKNQVVGGSPTGRFRVQVV